MERFSPPTSPSWKYGPTKVTNDVLAEFADYLEDRDVKRTNFEGKVFYRPEKIKAWISKNAGILLNAIYATEIPPILANQVTNHHLVLAILVHPDMGCGHMISSFQRVISDGDLSGDISKSGEELLADLESHRTKLPVQFKVTGYKGVTDAFDEIRWRFCPISLSLGMDKSYPHGLSILPFCHRDVVINKGGTSEVHSYKIQAELVESEELRKVLQPSINDISGYGPCYEVAVKSYLPQWSDIHQLESQAFKGVRDIDGVVKYIGEYHFYGGDQPTQHNIILEYGEQDLDMYLADTYPPILNEEIISFWKDVFDIAKTLDQVHRLKYRRDTGQVQRFRGCHGDVKPENILRVHGRYKLADFGFAKFEGEGSREKPQYLMGGTRTFGAPERDANIAKANPTTDTWSFGCVLSAVASWVVLGSQGYLAYDVIRRNAISNLRKFQKLNDRVSVPDCEDAFHDGKGVLSIVKEWHKYLRNAARKTDTVTHLVLDLVDNEMLRSDPSNRLTSKDLCEKLNWIVEKAQEHYEAAVLDPYSGLNRESKQIIDALRDYDAKVPEVAQPLNTVRNTTSVEARDGDGRLALPSPNPPTRFNKSERVDKILVGKIANRTTVLNDLSGGIYESPITMSPDLGPYRQRPAETKGKGLEDIQPATRPENSGALQISAPQFTYGEREVRSEEQRDLATHGSARRGAQGTSPRRDSSRLAVPHDLPPTNILELDASRGDHQLDSSPKLSANTQDSASSNFKRYPSERLSIQTSAMSGGDGQHRSQRFDYTAPSHTISPSRTAVYKEFANQQQIWNHRPIMSTMTGAAPSADPHLGKFISNRDIKFIVDNAGSMQKHWNHVKTTLLALAMKIGQLDKDGLDLEFTLGEAHNLHSVKGDKIRKKFAQSMEDASKSLGDGDHTNMAATLRKVFDDYYSDTRKRQTLLILTDGLWNDGASSKEDVETAIRMFINTLNSRLKKMERRWFTIGFISFGDDPQAISRLDALDNRLGGTIGEEDDIVDHKPWHFDDVDKMILGSIRVGDDEAAGPSARRQSPPPPGSANIDRSSRLFKHSTYR